MIAFGCAITRPDDYARFAQPGIERAREPSSLIIPNSAPNSIFRAYNHLLDLAAPHEDLEALVLMHQDVEIVDDELCAKVRRALADEEVGVAGCVGAVGVRSMAWWEGGVTWASFSHRYYEMGGGEIPAFTMDADSLTHPGYARNGEVETVDGILLVLSPWVVRNVRFDESLGRFHGYDFDFCLQVREAGRKIVTADFKVVHHHSLDLFNDPENWVNAHMQISDKWDGKMTGVGTAAGDWKARARRAEAEASAMHMLRVSAEMRAAARERELTRELDIVTKSTSWRLTAPLRKLGGLRARRRA